MGRHELLDLAEVLADRLAAPLCLGRRNRDARELAQRRERQRARSERLGEHRQLRERARDAQPLQRNPRRVAECALEVVEHRDHAERLPDAGDFCLAQPARLLGVESSAALRDAAQCEIDSLDVSIARHDVVLTRDISGLWRATWTRMCVATDEDDPRSIRGVTSKEGEPGKPPEWNPPGLVECALETCQRGSCNTLSPTAPVAQRA